MSPTEQQRRDDNPQQPSLRPAPVGKPSNQRGLHDSAKKAFFQHAHEHQIVGKPVGQNRRRFRGPTQPRETQRQRQKGQHHHGDHQDQDKGQSRPVAAEPSRRRRHRRQDQRRHQPQQDQLFRGKPNDRRVPRSRSFEHRYGGETGRQPKPQGQHDQHIEHPAHRPPNRPANPFERHRQARAERQNRNRHRRDPPSNDHQDQCPTERARAGEQGAPPTGDQAHPVQPATPEQQDR